MAYGTEAMSPIEVSLPSPCLAAALNEITNGEIRQSELDFLEEKKDNSQIKLASYQRK